MIIVDGADDDSLFYPSDSPERSHRSLALLPRVKHGALLITSRVRSTALNIIGAVDELDDIFTVDIMTDEEAKNLLKWRLPDHLWDEDSATKLIKALENIPLAITQAAAYIERMVDWNISDYLRYFEEFRSELLSRNDIIDSRREQDASNAIWITWQVSLNNILETQGSAAELLCLMSAFDNQSIPRYLLSAPLAIINQGALDQDDPVTQKYKAAQSDGDRAISKSEDIVVAFPQSDELRFEQDISLLADFGMITLDKDLKAYSMHSLVQSVITDWLSRTGGTPYSLQEYRDQAMARVSMAFPYGAIGDLRKCSELYRHAAKVLTYTAKGRIQLLHQAEILYRMAIYFRDTGQLSLAEEKIKASLDIRTKSFIGYNLCVAKTLQITAGILMQQSRYEEAEVVSKEALECFSVSMGFSRSMKDSIRMSLGVSLINQGKYKEARVQVESAVKSATARLDLLSSEYLGIRRIQAVLYSRVGEMEKAVEELRDIIVQFEGMTSYEAGDIVEMSKCRKDLSGILTQLGRYGEAETVSRNAIISSRAELGEEHPLTLEQAIQLSSVLGYMGAVEEQERILRDVVQLTNINFDIQHPLRQKALYELVALLSKRGCYREVLGLENLTLGPAPLGTVLQGLYWRAMGQRAEALRSLGRLLDARTAYEGVLEGLEKALGSSSEIYYVYAITYAGCLEDLKLPKQCLRVLENLKWEPRAREAISQLTLSSAVRNGRLEMVKWMLDKGADFTVASNDGWTPLHSAANRGHIEVVKLLLDKGADLIAANNGGWTPLSSAASSGHVEVVRLLLDKGADFTVASNDGWTPLDLAASNGYIEVVKLLLDKGANLTVTDNGGRIPLTSAASRGHVEVVRLLLDKGADLTVASNGGWTPLDVAVHSGHVEVVKLLLDKGADLTVASNGGWTPLVVAVHSGHVEVVKLLLDKGANLTVTDNDGWTPLNSAASTGYVEVVRLLLDKGADLTVASNGGWTPLDIAVHSGHVEVVKLLLDKGADLTVASNGGWTPLNAAASNGHVEIVKLLLDKGADLTVTNKDGWTPLISAAHSSHHEVVKCLTDWGADNNQFGQR